MEYLPYILLAVTLLIIALQLFVHFAAKRAQGRVAPPHEDLVGEDARALPQLLFYFHSEHCGPCRQMTPLVEALARSHRGVVVIDVAHNMAAARRFGVRVTPTLMRVRGGVIDKVVVGAISEQKLAHLLDGEV